MTKTGACCAGFFFGKGIGIFWACCSGGSFGVSRIIPDFFNVSPHYKIRCHVGQEVAIQQGASLSGRESLWGGYYSRVTLRPLSLMNMTDSRRYIDWLGKVSTVKSKRIVGGIWKNRRWNLKEATVESERSDGEIWKKRRWKSESSRWKQPTT